MTEASRFTGPVAMISWRPSVLPSMTMTAVRLGTTNAETAYARLRQSGARLHNDEIVHLDGSPPMFFFADPDGNGLVYLEEDSGARPWREG